MMHSRTNRMIGLIFGCWVALALSVGGFWITAEGQDKKDTKVAIPAEQVIVSIRTAIAAKPGEVQAVEVEKEGGKTICEVVILAQDGKTYEVEVDVATNTVIEVEEDDDNDKDGNDKD
jgi:hypothetical protein